MKQNIIAIIFDFDITLSPEFQQQVLFDDWSIDAEDFWREAGENIKNGYDMEHGYLKTLIDYGKRDEKYALDNKKLYEFGKKVELYEGLSEKDGSASIFDDLEAILERDEFKEHNIKLEFYCISAGIVEMIDGALEAHNLRDYFKDTVGHTIKTQKLYMISKGVLPSLGREATEVNKVTKEYRIPCTQMIFLGDGQTNIPAFSLINKMGGRSIAVYREEKKSDGSIDEEATLKNYAKGYELAVASKISPLHLTITRVGSL